MNTEIINGIAITRLNPNAGGGGGQGISDAPSGGLLYVRKNGEWVKYGTPVANTIPAAGMLPNVFYKLGELSSDLTVTLQSPVDQTISNEYRLRFSLGATAHTITFPNTVKWPKGVTPSFAANTTYEVNIEDGYGYIGEF